jgi:hypothetical protein
MRRNARSVLLMRLERGHLEDLRTDEKIIAKIDITALVRYILSNYKLYSSEVNLIGYEGDLFSRNTLSGIRL